MPELPEVETVCRGLQGRLVGRRIRRLEQRRAGLRLPFPENFPARLEGRRIEAIRRRAKYLLWELDDSVLIVHLGMSGRLFFTQNHDPGRHDHFIPGRHDHVIIETDDGTTVVFNDVRRFGLMVLAASDAIESHPLLAGLGPEPLGNRFNAEDFSARLRGRQTPIKAALLDQKMVAGVGNIYACEALFRARISPRRLAASVAGKRAERLVPAVQAVLRDAIAAGGSSLRDYVQASGELGYFQHDFSVYGREGEKCPGCDCDRAVRRISQAGRSTFYCAKRQR
jgi:formamidopyrimidine-DNA glycosylase